MDKQEMIKGYEEILDYVYDGTTIANMTFTPSRILKALAPESYWRGFELYIAEQKEKAGKQS